MGKNLWSVLSIIFAFLCSPIGLICGIIALVQIKKDPIQEGKGLAVAGLVLSILGILAWIFIFIIFITLSSYMGLDPTKLIPDKCSLPTGWDCSDYNVDSSKDLIMIQITNAYGRAMKIYGFTATPSPDNPVKGTCDASEWISAQGGPVFIENGESVSIEMKCPSIDDRLADPDNLYTWNLEGKYSFADSVVEHPVIGQLRAPIS